MTRLFVYVATLMIVGAQSVSALVCYDCFPTCDVDTMKQTQCAGSCWNYTTTHDGLDDLALIATGFYPRDAS